MGLSIEESEPSSSVEQTGARQALYAELEDIAEQHRHEHELVDKFVDSRGIERKPSAELVRLNPEAVEAIDSYFTEHDELADSIEALLVFTQDLAPHATKLAKEYESGQNPKPLAKLTDPVQLQSVIESVMSAPSVQPEVVLPEELATKITAEIQKIEEATKILNLPAASQDAGSIIAFVEALPEGVRQSWQFPGNIKLRMSGRARSESLDKINTLIANTQGASHLAKSTLVELLAQHLPTTIAPVFEQVRPLQTSIDTENHGHEHWYRRLQSQNEISPRNAPTQNEVFVAELTPDIQELTKQFEYISSCEAALQSALASPQILAALRHLEASDIAMLSESVAKVNQSVLASPSIEPIMKGFEQTYKMAPIVYAEALERAKSAIKTLYNEPALPKLYISPQEETRLQELIGMYNQLGPAAQLDAQAQLKEIKIPNFEIQSPLKMYTHFTPFMDAILKDGSLRTKQQQIDVLGTLHENTRPGIHKGDVIATHSSVIHFDTDISSYASSAEGHQSGILFIPLGNIIKTAPIDYLGRRLITLPSSDTQAPPAPSIAIFGSHGGDYVFYASPKASERDSYSIGLDDGCGAVLIGGEATATAYTRPGGPLVETASGFSKGRGPIAQASEKIQRELFEHSEYAGGIVVPLRIAPMEFVAEVPGAGLPNRFQHSSTKEIRNTSEVKRIRSDSWA